VKRFLSAPGRRRLPVLAFGLIAALLSGAPATHAQPTPEDARALVQGVGTDVLEILRDPALTERTTLTRLEDVLEGPIDLELVARLILGRHWRTASEQQREQYLELFRAYALDNLASRIHLYEGQDFEITGAQVVSDRDAVVTTRIVGGQQPLTVNWRLREVNGNLVAIDVVVEGVSLIVSLRSEFDSVIERQGLDGLLAQLRQRVSTRA
jgi:phospholipid transport system substrate-binding protein